MKNITYYPFKLKPIYKNYPWGGTRISKTYHRHLADGIHAESWEISDRPDGMSIVSNGPMAGTTLGELTSNDPLGMIGSRATSSIFPVLIKLIDAAKTLSVQVHPDEKIAKRDGGEAKTEIWYLLGENSETLYCGIKKGVTKIEFKNAIITDTTQDTLQSIPVHHGSTVLVQGGCIHAITAGCFIFEIQRNSNTTYRIYDWNRIDTEGNRRDLHIEKALRSIHWNSNTDPVCIPKTSIDTPELKIVQLASCPYFSLEKLTFSAPFTESLTGETFHTLFVAEGKASLVWEGQTETLITGESILIPAALPAYTLTGNATILRSYLPADG